MFQRVETKVETCRKEEITIACGGWKETGAILTGTNNRFVLSLSRRRTLFKITV